MSGESLFLIQCRKNPKDDVEWKDRIVKLLLHCSVISDEDSKISIIKRFEDEYFGSGADCKYQPTTIDESIIVLKSVGDLGRLVASGL
jgi:hypothetical protein